MSSRSKTPAQLGSGQTLPDVVSDLHFASAPQLHFGRARTSGPSAIPHPGMEFRAGRRPLGLVEPLPSRERLALHYQTFDSTGSKTSRSEPQSVRRVLRQGLPLPGDPQAAPGQAPSLGPPK